MTADFTIAPVYPAIRQIHRALLLSPGVAPGASTDRYTVSHPGRMCAFFDEYM